MYNRDPAESQPSRLPSPSINPKRRRSVLASQRGERYIFEHLEGRVVLSLFTVTSSVCEVWAEVNYASTTLDYQQIEQPGTVSASGHNSYGSASCTASLTLQTTNNSLTAQATASAQITEGSYLSADTYISPIAGEFGFTLSQTSLCQVQSTVDASGRSFSVYSNGTELPITSTMSTMMLGGPYTIAFLDGAGADGALISDSISATLTLSVVNSVPTSCVLSSSPNPSNLGQPVTFKAAVSPRGSVVGLTPTGTVTFMNGETNLWTVALGASDTATLTSSTLALGTDSITAVYSGDSNFAGSNSSSISQVVLGTFTVTTTADSGAGSLRAAVTAANASYSTDTINFATGLSGTINLDSALPALTSAVSR